MSFYNLFMERPSYIVFALIADKNYSDWLVYPFPLQFVVKDVSTVLYAIEIWNAFIVCN